MKCSELQSDLSLYADSFLSESKHILVKGHLDACPLCRQRHAEIREIKTGLRQMSRPEISSALQNQLKRSLRAELRNGKTAWLPISAEAREWLQTRMMPYGIGVLATLVVGFTFLSMMFSGMLEAGQITAALQNPYYSESVMLASNTNPFRDPNSGDLSPTEYARSRLNISNESPSINPRGALIALTKSLIRGGMKDGELVVVADVLSNGRARITEVVEPSRDSQAVGELQKALAADPAYSPFVAANLDNRSDNVRVVLKFQSVDVSTGVSRYKH